MAETVLFHHVGGLVALARLLRDAGHAVRTPDLFGGRLARRCLLAVGVTDGDEWRKPDAGVGYLAEVPGAELFVCPGSRKAA